MNFCSACGATVSFRIPEGDSLPRHVCDNCGEIHYSNPKMVVGAIVESERRILLCRRAIEPRRGLWTLPAGFMENGETTAEAAARETLEEAQAHIDVGEAFAMVSIPHISQVHLFYLATFGKPGFGPGEESLEVALFDEAQVPWASLAFRSTALALRHFFADRAGGRFRFHADDLAYEPAQQM